MYVAYRTDASALQVHSHMGEILREQTLLNEESMNMLWAILVVLLLLWLIGFYGGFVTTSLIHLLLVGAVIVLALNLFRRRNPA
jgi:hypothetical protein